MDRTYYTYIVTNKWNRVLYTGVTGDLVKRIYQHREKLAQGFASHYNIDKLVYFETFNDPLTAIEREKQLKAGSRNKKIKLIEQLNPEWKDLFPEIASHHADGVTCDDPTFVIANPMITPSLFSLSPGGRGSG